MQLRQLELFVAVAEQGSFSRGAETALRTQSTVSQQIAALEAEIGTKLFDRTGRGVELTGGGRLLLEEARRVLAELDRLQMTMAAFRGSSEQTVSVGASNIPATYLFPALLPELSRRFPGLSLQVISADSREILRRLVAAEYELAVIGKIDPHCGCDFRALTVDELELVVAPGHRWANISSIEFADLLTEPLLLRETGSGSGEALMAALQERGVEAGRIRVAARLGSNEAIKEAVISGIGGAFLSRLSIRREVERKELIPVKVKGFVVSRRLWLAQRSGRTLSPATAQISGLLQEIYGEEAAG